MLAPIGSFGTALRAQWRDERLTRARVFEILFDTTPDGDHVSRAVDLFLIVLIVANVIAVMLDSVAPIAEAYRAPLFWFEAFSVTIFLGEYVLRVWSIVESEKFGQHGPLWGRIRYALTPMALTDLIVILPFFILMFAAGSVDLRFLRIMRLRRAFKLTRYSPDMSIIFGVLRDEFRTLAAAGFVLVLLVVMSASLIFVLEGDQEGPFASIPGAMSFALHNLTSVGNADMQPDQPLARAFASFIAILGVLFVAMLSGLFAAGFVNENQKRHKTLRRFVKIQLMTHGGLTPAAEAAIERQRRHMGLTAPDTLEVINDAMEEQANDLEALREMARRDDKMLRDDVLNEAG